jgi:glucose/mannose-6-phosphate isomerase
MPRRRAVGAVGRGRAKRSLDAPLDTVDPSGMARRIETLAEQVRSALDGLESHPWAKVPRAPQMLVVGGLGGSAIAAELTRATMRGLMPLPVVAVRDYEWPGWVDDRSLVVLSSYSGDTEETLALAATSARTGAGRVGLTSGGKLASWCAREQVPLLRLPPGYAPRAAVPTAWVLLSELCVRAHGAVSLAGEWQAAAETLDRGMRRLGTRVPESRNAAKQLARALHGRLPIVIAVGEELQPIATRWRQQLNENAKMPAYASSLPEIDHNEIEAWPSTHGRSFPASLVLLRGADEHSRLEPRVRVTRDAFTAAGIPVHEVRARGESRLPRLASLFQWGDYVSLYLAVLNGEDPTPVTRLDQLKKRLAKIRGPVPSISGD